MVLCIYLQSLSLCVFTCGMVVAQVLRGCIRTCLWLLGGCVRVRACVRACLSGTLFGEGDTIFFHVLTGSPS